MSINLLQEEIDEIKGIREKSEKLVINLGEITVQRLKLDLLEEGLKEELRVLILKEQGLSDSLVEKYGPMSIDIETGTATKIT